MSCYNLKFNLYDNAYYLGNGSNLYVALIKAANKDITSCEVYRNAKMIAQNAFADCT